MRLKSMLVVLFILGLSGMGNTQEEETLTISPRWDTVWVSPRLKSNWVVLRFQHKFAKGKDPTGKITIDLSKGVSLGFPVWGEFKETKLPKGETRYEFSPVRMTDGSSTKGKRLGLYYLSLSTTLEPGTEAKMRISAKWRGGEMKPRIFPINVIDAPAGQQPKSIVTGSATWSYQIGPDFYEKYASLGFNLIDYWVGYIHATSEVHEPLKESVELARKHGITTSINASTSWDAEKIKEDPEAHAMYFSGKKYGEIACPSYRGPGFLDKMKFNAEIAKSGISHIQSDEELYINSGAGGNMCICERCEARWKEWLAKQYPELEYVSPGEVYKNREEYYPEHYRAWQWFMASLTTERYKIYKEELEKAVDKYDAKSSPRALLSWWAGAAEYGTLRGQQDGRGLSQTIDYLFLQLYYRYKLRPRHFRAAVRRHSWAVDGIALCAGIDTDDHFGDANTPGILAAGVLETLFAGGKGYCLWYGPYMDTRQWAELGRVNDVIAKHERTFLEGKETDLFRSFNPIVVEGLPKGYFQPWSPDVCTSTWENETEGLLLITDYREERTPIWVERSLKYTGPMTLYDAFTDEEVVHLTEGRWDFRIHLDELPVRMLYWNKKPRE